jgi:hypothetical protein
MLAVVVQFLAGKVIHAAGCASSHSKAAATPCSTTMLLLCLCISCCRYDDDVCTLHNAAAAGTAAERFLTGSEAATAAAATNASVTCLSFRTGVCGPTGLPWLQHCCHQANLHADSHQSLLTHPVG